MTSSPARVPEPSAYMELYQKAAVSGAPSSDRADFDQKFDHHAA